jgi:hypothetical protein
MLNLHSSHAHLSAPTAEPFYAAVREIKMVRNQTVSSFDMAVADAVHETLIQALEDSANGLAVYRVLSAPTGSGKSTFAISAMKAVVHEGGSCLFLCETMQQLEDMYKEVTSIIDPFVVGVFSSAHDIRTPVELVERDHGFRPSFQMARSQMKDKQVLLCTHAFYRDRNGHMAMEYRGMPRTVTFIDERPNEVAVYEVTTADVKQIRDALANAYGQDFPGVTAATNLHNYLEEEWADGGISNYERLYYSKEIEWFQSQACTDTLAAGELKVFTHEVFKKVVGLARSIISGYAFAARYTRPVSNNRFTGGLFIGYDLDMPIRPGTIVLDATADLDGVSKLAQWRIHSPTPRVTFENLQITHIGIPDNIVAPGESWSSITGNRRRAIPYGQWIMSEVEKNTSPGDKVLVVTHKAIVENNYVPADHRFFEEAYDLNGRQVCFVHWGAGVGSNRWQDADTVMLFGEFHIPRRVVVGQALGYSRKEATEETLKPYQLPNDEPKDFATLRDGHLDRWLKQLAMRGRARRLDRFGKCGKQRLFITADYERVVNNLNILFPGAELTRDTLSVNNSTGRGGKLGLITVLRERRGDRLDAFEIKDQCGVDMVKHGFRYLSDGDVQQVMRDYGWTWVKGKRGRGSVISHFTRTSVMDCPFNNDEQAA